MSVDMSGRGRAARGLRVNVYERAINEPRIRRVARKVQLSHFDVLGRMTHLWMLCMQRRDEFIDPIDADIATGELPGFIDAVVTEGLADRVDDNTLRVRGAEEQIAQLEAMSERGRESGIKSGEARRRRSATIQNRTTVQQRFGFGSTENEPRLNSRSETVEPTRNGNRNSDLISSDLSDLGSASPNGHTSNQYGEPISGSDASVTGGDTQAEKTQHARADAIVEGSRRQSPAPPEQAFTLAHLLINLVSDNHPSGRLAKSAERLREATAERWAHTIDKLHRLDKMEWSAIQAMIMWSQRDRFWQTVILGADNLREKWDQMAAQRNRVQPLRDAKEPRSGPTANALREVEELAAAAAADKARRS